MPSIPDVVPDGVSLPDISLPNVVPDFVSDLVPFAIDLSGQIGHFPF